MQKIQGERYALHYLDSADELRAALQTASQETHRLLQLARDLLLIASSDRGQLPLRLECLSAREVLDSVRQRLPGADAVERQLVLDAPDDLPPRARVQRFSRAEDSRSGPGGGTRADDRPDDRAGPSRTGDRHQPPRGWGRRGHPLACLATEGAAAAPGNRRHSTSSDVSPV